MSKMRRTVKQRQFWGTGNIGNKDFDLGNRKLRNSRELVPPGRASIMVVETKEFKGTGTPLGKPFKGTGTPLGGPPLW